MRRLRWPQLASYRSTASRFEIRRSLSGWPGYTLQIRHRVFVLRWARP